MYTATELPILMFHDISDERAAIAMSPTIFQRGLARLHAAGFRSLSLEDVAQRLRQPASAGLAAGAAANAPFPDNAVVITFDDGSASVYNHAFPVLQQHGFTATVFLTVGDGTATTTQSRLPSREERPMLSWGEIREMQRYGIAFGAHTLTHPNLARIRPDRAEVEIRTSQAVVADALGVAVPTFAYPYGYYNETVRQIVSRYFACACSVRLGLVNPASDLYTLERVDSYYVRTDRLFAWMVSPRFPWYVRARAIPRRIRRALNWRMG